LDGFLRLLWIIPLLIGLRFFNPAKIAALLLLGILANLRAWQSSQLVATLAEYRLRRDELSAQFSVLQEKNYDLAERQLMDLRLATLTERSRVAREIHDNVGHLLTRLILQTQAMQLVYGRNAQLLDSSAGQPTTEQPGRQLAEQLTEIGQTLRQAYDSVRQSVHGLQEEAFELSLQLQALAHESENSSLRIRLNYDVQTESPPRFISYSVLAIVREALVNIQKHSDATAVNIALTEFPAFYQLTIQDNGTTKPASADLSRNGIGLTNMEDRVVSLGGVFSAGWDNGFRIFASLPKESAGKSGG
jgi:signal transduction histidine kinase